MDLPGADLDQVAITREPEDVGEAYHPVLAVALVLAGQGRVTRELLGLIPELQRGEVVSVLDQR